MNTGIIVIENKIYTGEGWEQLERYRKDYKTGLLVLLTLDGHESESKKDNDYVLSISYRDDIARWLKQCSKETVTRPLVRETILQYEAVVANFNRKIKE